MRLGSEIIYLVGLCLFQDMPYPGAICEVAVVKKETGLGVMWVRINMVDSISVKDGRSANDPMDLVAFIKKQLGQV